MAELKEGEEAILVAPIPHSTRKCLADYVKSKHISIEKISEISWRVTCLKEGGIYQPRANRPMTLIDYRLRGIGDIAARLAKLRNINKKGPAHPRDENLRQVRKSTRKKWKKTSGYHKRSLSEAAMFRFKTIFSPTLNSRTMANQKTEAMIMANALNKMTRLGMPDTHKVMI